jgi:hypothetical protein
VGKKWYGYWDRENRTGALVPSSMPLLSHMPHSSTLELEAATRLHSITSQKKVIFIMDMRTSNLKMQQLYVFQV